MILAKEGLRVVWDRNRVLLSYVAIVVTINLIAIIYTLWMRGK